MSKTPLEAIKELNRLKRLKDAGLPYSDEEKQQAWNDAYAIEEEFNANINNALTIHGISPQIPVPPKTKDDGFYTDKHGNPVHDLVHRTPPKAGDE